MAKKTNTQEGNLYDKILKENAEQLFLPLVEERLNIKIKSFQPLQEKLQTTIEREMDFFYEVTTETEISFLLHLEFQTENDPEMIYRAAEYHGMAFRRKKIPIKHIVIFLGAGALTMKTEIAEEEVFKGFEVIHVYTMNTSVLLASQVPEIILLAILSEIPSDKIESVLRLLIQQLKKVCKNENQLSRYLKQLIILSRLRKFEDTTIKIIEDMPITYDIETDYLYLRGEAKGVAKGEARGEAKGEARGKIKGEIKKSILGTKKMLDKQFDILLITELLDLEEAFVLQIQKELAEQKNILLRLKKGQKVKKIAKTLKVSELLVEVLKELSEKEQAKGK